jgi:hypothetical protein
VTWQRRCGSRHDPAESETAVPRGAAVSFAEGLEAVTRQKLESIRTSIRRGRPYGDEDWLKSCVERLQLESTLRPRGRPLVRTSAKNRNKES